MKAGNDSGRAPRLRDALAQRPQDLLTSYQNVREGRMFGGLSFIVDDRVAVAAGRNGDLLVCTDPGTHGDLLKRGGDPAYMGKDRPMGPGWLSVPYERIQDNAELEYSLKVGIDSRNASN